MDICITNIQRKHTKKYTLYPTLMLKSAASVLRTVTDFGIFHSKAALEKGTYALYCTLIIFR